MMTSAKEIFESYVVNNSWENDESRSGPGSTLAYTANLRSKLPEFIEKFDIKSIFDAPCGDFNWMKEIPFPDDLDYVGSDIAPTLIRRNNRLYRNERRVFLELDITQSDFPKADLWICRDCFFHLPLSYIINALENFVRSDIKYIMTTTHINNRFFKFINTDIDIGGFRLIDMFSAPFNLPPEVVVRLDDYVRPFPPRELCVWTRDQVATAIRGTNLDEWVAKTAPRRLGTAGSMLRRLLGRLS